MGKNMGLTDEEAEKINQTSGLNEIREEKPGLFRKFFRWFISPIALMLLAAAVLSLFIDKSFDFYFILVLMLINFSVGFWQEKKADHAIEKLSQKLSIEVKVLRGGEWKWMNARYLAVGDFIEMNMGDIVPADVKVSEEKNLSINEAALTGESLPKDKSAGDTCFSGSFVAVGFARAEVIATGRSTYFGNILTSIDKTYRPSLLERDILSISQWLTALSLAAAVILTVVFIFQGKPLLEILTLDLSLFIAGIPISLPTVMTLIISFGVVGLAKKKTIVRRLSALEDLANVNLLLSDKTGTLTKNEIVVEKIIAYGNFSEEDALMFTSCTTRDGDRNPINIAVRKKVAELQCSTDHEILDFSPFDSERKRSSAKVMFQGKHLSIRVGAAQVIRSFCDLDDVAAKKFERDVAQAAETGYRTVAVSVKDYASGKTTMDLCGLLLFSDSLEKGAKHTTEFIRENGIQIKMLTGDNIAIAERIAGELDLEGITTSEKRLEKNLKNLSPEEFDRMGVFAEILPIDKYHLVKIAQRKYVVAVTGDGVNDLPALKAADVSIAVKNAVDALKSVADLNLLGHGISVIQDAIIESRKIFARLYAYSVYRISESFRVVLTIAVLGVVYGVYPLQPIQLILLALLNDIPIISLAFNRVKIATQPSKINVKSRLLLSSLFGCVGLANSVLFVMILRGILHLDWEVIQTLFFLKLTVSGHMLIYVAHTRERWYRYLPSSPVIWATTATQGIATLFAALGIFMPAVSAPLILFVWVWAFFWMQVSELMKGIR
ncbi:MAG: plasma-membrane proton-efflux P-type ATPase [Candidatus Moraniibacteriota bacterium]